MLTAGEDGGPDRASPTECSPGKNLTDPSADKAQNPDSSRSLAMATGVEAPTVLLAADCADAWTVRADVTVTASMADPTSTGTSSRLPLSTGINHRLPRARSLPDGAERPHRAYSGPVCRRYSRSAPGKNTAPKREPKPLARSGSCDR